MTELSKINGTISNALSTNKDKIASFTNLTEQKKFIEDLIMNLTDNEKKSVATLRFLNSLKLQKNTNSVLMLVWNTMLKSDGLGVI